MLFESQPGGFGGKGEKDKEPLSEDTKKIQQNTGSREILKESKTISNHIKKNSDRRDVLLWPFSPKKIQVDEKTGEEIEAGIANALAKEYTPPKEQKQSLQDKLIEIDEKRIEAASAEIRRINKEEQVRLEKSVEESKNNLEKIWGEDREKKRGLFSWLLGKGD